MKYPDLCLPYMANDVELASVRGEAHDISVMGRRPDQHVRSNGVFADAGTVELTFASVAPRVLLTNVKSKAALET
jgi:hypothetical protein